MPDKKKTVKKEDPKKIVLNTTLPSLDRNNLLFKKLFVWEAPERVWHEKTRAWYVLYSLFFVSIIAVVALLGQYLFVMAIISFVFLWFIQGSIPPRIVEYSITTIGVKVFDQIFRWDDIEHFWFSKKNEYYFFNLQLVTNEANKENFKRLHLLINKGDDLPIFNILIDQKVDYGDNKEIGYNFLDEIIRGKHIPLINYLPENLYTQKQYVEYVEETTPEENKKTKSKKN